MAYENVRLAHGNICTDRAHTYVTTFDHDVQAAVEKDKSSGAVIKSWPSDSFFTEVFSLEFDGYYWWSLERVPLGLVIRKWEKKAGVFCSLVSSFSYSSLPSLTFDSYAFCVESVNTTVVLTTGPAVSSVDLDDASAIRIGDDFVLGPSSVTGYIDGIDKGTVVGKAGNTVSVLPPITNRYTSGDWFVSPQSFWVLNNGGNGTAGGSLLKMNAKSGSIVLVDYKSTYRDSIAATFYDGKVLFFKGSSVLWYTTSSVNLFQVMAVDTLKSDRSTYSTVYDMYAFDDVLYRLQREVAFESSGWSMETWSTYNIVSSNIIPEVYMVAVSAEKPVQHRVLLPYVTTVSSTINCVVYDQFLTPVLGKTVDFTTSAGTVSPPQAVTDANGACRTVYTGDTAEALVEITATTI